MVIAVVEVNIDELVIDSAWSGRDRLVVLQPEAARVVPSIMIALAHPKEREVDHRVLLLLLTCNDSVPYEDLVLQIGNPVFVQVLQSVLTLLSHLVILMANRARP